MSRIMVKQLQSPQQAYSFLLKDRLYSAYALGGLETEQWACHTALLAYDGETELALFLLSQPLEATSTLFVMGQPLALEQILQHPMAKALYAWINAKEEHLSCLRRYWRVEDAEKMLRMAVNRRDFRSPGGVEGWDLRRLDAADGPALAQAYEVAFGTPTAARLLERGPYYGVWRKGELISVAGTHVVCHHFGFAAAGNVWTTPAQRGQGLATLTVGAVTAELLESCEEVVLNVRDDNLAARRVYERLGYRPHCFFWQMRGRWRG